MDADNIILETLVDSVETAEKAGEIAMALIQFCGLPDSRQTYSWLGLMCKRYGIDNVRSLTLSILEAGTTIADFDADSRHFRSWYVATLKGRSAEASGEGMRIFA